MGQSNDGRKAPYGRAIYDGCGLRKFAFRKDTRHLQLRYLSKVGKMREKNCHGTEKLVGFCVPAKMGFGLRAGRRRRTK